MVKLDKTVPRLGPTGDLTRQFDEDCGPGKADFEAAAAELRGLGQIAKRQALTTAEAAAFDDALARVSRQYAHLVSYARVLPAIARNRHQSAAAKGAKPGVSALIAGPIKAEFLAWRRGQPTQEDYTPTGRARWDQFAEAMEKRHGVDARTVTNNITRNKWLDDV